MGGGGNGRKGQGEHGPAGAAAPLDGAWQEQGKGRSASRNRLGLENLDAKVQESVHLLVQALQPDAQSKGKGMAGLAARKGKGKGAQLEKETVFDQVAIEQCVNKIKHLRAMLESATLLRNQGGFAAPDGDMHQWSQEVERLVLELATLKKGVERILPGYEPMVEDDGEEEPDIDAEGYLAGQRRWKVDPKVPLGDKIQRSLTREAKLFKAQARIQSEVDKLLVVIDLAKEQIGERHARIKEVFTSVEAERVDRAGWQKEYEEQEYPDSSSDSESDGDQLWHEEQGGEHEEERWAGREHGHKRMRRHGDEGGSSRRGRATHKDDFFGVPRALKVILAALKPRCQESADLRKCAGAVLRKFNMREMGADGSCEAGVDISILSAQNEQRFAAMELGAKEAGARVINLEEQAAKMRQEGSDARNAYQQQRAYIQAQLGDGADATKLHDFLHGLVASMDVQFGITGTAGDVDLRSHGTSGYSPASSVGRGGGRPRQDRRRTIGGAGEQVPGGEMRRDRSPRLGSGREGNASEDTGER